MTSTVSDADAERAVLGAVLLDNVVMDDALDVLCPDDFGIERHAVVYAAMSALAAERAAIDYLTLGDRLRATGDLQRIGGLAAIAGLDAHVPASGNWRRYAEVVRDLAIRRRAIAVLTEGIERLTDPTCKAVDALGDVEQALSRVQDKQTVEAIPAFSQVISDRFRALEALYDRAEEITGVPCGIESLDRVTAGWQANDLVIVAGRPSSGKSLAAMTFAMAAVGKSLPVLVFSQEMSRDQLVNRILAGEAQVDATKFRTGKFTNADFARMANAAERIHRRPLWIDERAGLSVPQIRARVRRVTHKHGKLAMVVVDYLQIMRSTDPRKNREQQVAEFAQGLKMLAREFQIPVIALAQVGRESEKRADKRPMMSDLRESGAIEAEADTVIFVHRPEMYDQSPDVKGVAEFIVAKHRAGSTGMVKAKFDGIHCTFRDMPQD